MEEFIVVLITAPSEAVGTDIARALLERELAACVNIVPAISSLYVWEGELQRDEEVLLIVKTKSTIFEDVLVPVVRSIHPYDVPEIIALPITEGVQDYLDWIDAEVNEKQR